MLTEALAGAQMHLTFQSKDLSLVRGQRNALIQSVKRLTESLKELKTDILEKKHTNEELIDIVDLLILDYGESDD